MGFKEKDLILENLNALFEQDEKFSYLIQKGRSFRPFPEEHREEKYLVKGCLSQLWLYPEFKEGKVFFFIDSDAAIPKGIAAVLADIYSGMTPSEILENKPDFLKDVGIEEHLSMNRRNGLANLTKQIQMYAFAFQALSNPS